MTYTRRSDSPDVCGSWYGVAYNTKGIDLCACEAECDADSNCAAFMHGNINSNYYQCAFFPVGEAFLDNSQVTSTMVDWDPRCYVQSATPGNWL